ncbi:MAG: pyrroloquinoline-quinone synthase [Myxococcota bacterium]
MTSSHQFLEALKRDVIEHAAIRHPLTSAFSERRIGAAQARRFAELYYPHILRTRRYQAAALSVCEDESMQLALAQILSDEYGHGDPALTHPAIYRKLLRALGLSTEAPTPSSGLRDYIATHVRLTTGDWLSAIGCAGLAMEWPIPTFYRAIVAGLRGAGLADDALELFIGHMTLDVEHAGLIHDALVPHLSSDEARARVRQGAIASMDARALWHGYIWSELG